MAAADDATESAIEALRAPFAQRAAAAARTGPLTRSTARPLLAAPPPHAQAIRTRRRRGVALRRLPASRRDLAASLTADERREILRGMVADPRHRQSSQDVLHQRRSALRRRDVPGEGVPVARPGSDLRRRHPAAPRRRRTASTGDWRGDVVAPMIRDLGASAGDAERAGNRPAGAVSADGQGRAADERQGPAHRGSRVTGCCRRSAPLGERRIDDCRHGDGVCARRVGPGRAVTLLGEGGTSLGEWHEAINLCAARRLPAIFCVQNNQTALSTPVRDQSAVRVFADKASGYGIPGITIDGTDPDEIAATFAWAVERARAGQGPTLDRARVDADVRARPSRRHALSRERCAPGRGPTRHSPSSGYADRERHAFWAARDPIPAYAARLEAEGIIDAEHLDVDQARGRGAGRSAGAAGDRGRWPAPEAAGQGVFADEPGRLRVDVARPGGPARGRSRSAAAGGRRRGRRSIRRGRRSSKAITLGVGDALRGGSAGIRLRRRRRRRRTATPSCCCGRCWPSSAIAS